MTIRTPLATLLLGLALAGLATAPARAAEADEATIRKLVEQLGADSFAEREAATKQLDRIGLPALKALQEAARSRDAEVRKRASGLADKLEKRVASARVLTPKEVHLVYKDTPLKAALEDLRKKTGYNVVLHDPENKLQGRKVTLDTGKTTFWSALEQFCAAAELSEGDPTHRANPAAGNAFPLPVPVPLPAPVPGIRIAPARRVVPAQKEQPARPEQKPDAQKEQPAKPEQKSEKRPDQPAKPEQKQGAQNDAERKEAVKKALLVLQQLQVQPAVQPAGPAVARIAALQLDSSGYRGAVSGQITLVPGKPKKLPSDTSSSVRVRQADPATRPVSFGEQEVGVLLEIAPEPRLRWQQVTAVMIDRAIDDRGQKLSQADTATDPNRVQVNGNVIIIRGGVVMPGVGGRFATSAGGVHHYTAVRLKKGDQASKGLKELSGTISGLVLSDPEKMLVLDDLGTVGKRVQGKDGGRLEITGVEKQADGSTHLTFEFEAPPGVYAETGTPGVRVNRQVQIQNGQMVAVAIASSGYSPYGVTVEDGKGNPLPASVRVNYKRTPGVAGVKMQYVAVLPAADGKQAAAARLVYTGRRQTSVTVPFKLTDLPLK